MQELSWKDTEDLVVMQPSVIPFSLMVSGRDYPGLFLICGLSVNAFGESSDCVRLCVLSVLKEAPSWTGSCPEPVSSAPHLPACSSALGPAAVTGVTALDLSRLCTGITGGRICLFPFSSLDPEHGGSAVPRAGVPPPALP